MKQVQAWKMVAGILAAFWLVFAVVLAAADFPFYIISIALTTVAALSTLVVALAWAYQNNK